MKRSNGLHLDDDQLTRAAVDQAELPLPLREHLSTCPVCRAKREETARKLARLGHMAARFAPSPTRHVALPANEPRFVCKRPWGWRAYVGAAAVAAALVLAVLWRTPVFRSPSDQNGDILAVEMQETEEFMMEVAMLVENALPPVYLDISTERSLDIDGEPMPFVVPSDEDEPLSHNSRKRGVSLC